MDDLKTIDEQLNKDLQELKLKYEQMEYASKRDLLLRNKEEEILIKRSEMLSALNQYSIDLADQEYDKIHSFVVFRLKKLFDARAIIISMYDEKLSELKIVTSTLTDDESSKILRHIGNVLKNYSTVVDKDALGLMLDTGTKVFTSLHEISFGQIPRLAGTAVEKLLNAGWFEGVALTDKGKLLGTLVIAGKKDQEEPDHDIVKIFAKITSISLRRKQAESKLLASENLFRKAFETSPDSVNINRMSDGMYVSINNSFTRISGYTVEDVLGKTSLELNLWADPSERDRLLRILSDKGEVQNMETLFRMKDGSLVYGIMSAAIIDLDGIPHILSITRDITDRKNAEEKLRKSEEKYRLLAENITDVIWVMDVTTMRFTYVSPSVERLRGYTPEEILMRPVTDALTPEGAVQVAELTRRGVEDLLNGKMKTGEFYINEIEQPCKNGSTVWTEVITSFYQNKEKGNVEVLGVTRDITARKKAEDEIHKLNTGLELRIKDRTAELEAANNELQAFAYSVSHDLRAPLRAIDGFSKYVLEDYSGKLDEEGLRFLELIRSNTRKMDKLITDLLSLSRVGRGNQRAAKIDMTKMAISMFNEAVSSLMPGKFNFSIGQLPDCHADPIYIKQVWINLISNAIKFSSLKSNPEILIDGSTKNGYNVYFISDNGAGFNPEYSHKLFNAFQRLHNTSEFEGSGVGLAIVKRIIQRHGGEVWAESAEGNGAKFYFSLPVKS